MIETIHTSHLSAGQTVALYRAALGASHNAMQSKDTRSALLLMERARGYKRIVKRAGKATDVKPLEAPSLDLMVETDPDSIAPMFAAILKEMGRAGALKNLRVVGSANADDEPFRPLVAKLERGKVRCWEIPVKVEPKASRAELVEAEKERRSKRVEDRKAAGIPERIRKDRLSEKVHKAALKFATSKDWKDTGLKLDDAKLYVRQWGKDVAFGLVK